MKNINPELRSHLENAETTTLATCLKITRLDGAVHRLTDHDVDITFSRQIYRANAGYTRTAISSGVSYESGNSDISGFFHIQGIPEAPTKNGLLDNADVEVFIVNYNDIDQGRLILLSGKVREIEYTATGKYTIELSGYKQLLSQSIGDVVQPECRADLGDHKCKFPLDPRTQSGDRKERSINTAYEKGEFILVATGNQCTEVSAGFQNLDFENSDGWVLSAGSQIVTDPSGAQSGSKYLRIDGDLNLGIITTVYQTITIANEFHARIDEGYMGVRSTYWQKINAYYIGMRFYAGTDRTLDPIFGFGYAASSTNWEERSNVRYSIIPPFTRELTLEIWSYGNNNRVDSLNIEFLVGNRDCYNVYEDRIYECTTAGTTAGLRPSYNTTIGATTTDGDPGSAAVFTARQSWSRHTLVGTVNPDHSRRIFNVGLTPLSHPSSDINDAADDWYNQGICIFENGNNAGLQMEIKDWDASAKQVTLWDAMPEPISSGDSIVLVTGCDKRITTCKNKFQIASSQDFAEGNNLNYRGEPYLPGRDRILVYPDR